MKFIDQATLESVFSNISYSLEDLSNEIKNNRHPISGAEIFDYVGYMERGSFDILNQFKDYQPFTFSQLTQMQASIVLAEKFKPHRIKKDQVQWLANLFLKVDDKFLLLHPYHRGKTIEALGPRHPAYQRYSSLPEEISKPYYSRVGGLEIVNQLPINPMDSRVLPSKITAWKDVVSLCATKQKKEALIKSLQKFDKRINEDIIGNYKIFLDTREQNDYGDEGEFLIVHESNENRNIYHLRNDNFEDIQLLSDPIERLDRYAASVLRGEDALIYKERSIEDTHASE